MKQLKQSFNKKERKKESVQLMNKATALLDTLQSEGYFTVAKTNSRTYRSPIALIFTRCRFIVLYIIGFKH